MISASPRTGKCVAIMKHYVNIMANTGMRLYSCYCEDMSTVCMDRFCWFLAELLFTTLTCMV